MVKEECQSALEETKFLKFQNQSKLFLEENQSKLDDVMSTCIIVLNCMHVGETRK
jgi:hypothetical protein